MVRLVQISHPEQGRRVGQVCGDQLVLLRQYRTVYDLAMAAIGNAVTLVESVRADTGDERIDYDPVYEGRSSWRLLPCFDHPMEPSRCHVSGTGLTHKASALNRQAMHESADDEQEMTDSMQMFQWGLERGHASTGAIGVQPEWFYKGNGSILRAHGEALEVPSFADDGGEEGEVAGLYLIDPDGHPRRVGMAIGNEFADHVMEKKNYLYLAPSKLRASAIGPELIAHPIYEDVRGTARVERQGRVVWSHDIATGERNMCHSLANLEHHQFKYEAHRRPGDVHVHFYGADAFSFGAGFALEDGDIMQIEWQQFGRPLRNPIRIDRKGPAFVGVKAL